MASKPRYEELGKRIKELEIETKRAEEFFQASEHEKETILNNLIEHVIYQDTEMRILWANRAACESVNLIHEEIVGRHCYEIWPQSSEPCPDCPVIKAMETCQPQEIEKSTPDGKSWIIRGYPRENRKGNIVGGVEVTLEVTDRKQAEEAQRESETKYSILVENSKDGIIMISEGVLTFVNKVSIELVGYSPEEMIGTNFLNFVADDYKELVLILQFPQFLYHQLTIHLV